VFAVERLGTPVAMVQLTSDAPELLLTAHLEGAQAILIFRVANSETTMREIIEHCGQIGGRFEMPPAVGARLRPPGATAAGERGGLRESRSRVAPDLDQLL
jgi:hypothetical protein